VAKEYRRVSIIVEVPNRKAFFNQTGVAFDNKDGSLNFQLHMFPGVKFHIGIPKVVNGEETHDDSPEKPF
jgi:hypothetical protein